MKHLMILSASALALVACEAGTERASTATDAPAVAAPMDASVDASAEADVNARLDAWFEETFMEGARRSPEFLAQLGMRERMDEWNDPSRAAELEDLEFTRRKLEELRASFDPEELDDERRLSYDLWVRTAERQLDGDRWHAHRYPFNQMFGAQSRPGPFLMNQHRITNVEDAESYIARLEGIDEVMDTIVARARASAEAGIMPPKFVYDHVLRDSRNMLSGAPFEDDPDAELNILLADFEKKVEALDIDEATKESLYERAIDALRTDVREGYETVIAEMERQQAVATTDDGVWKLPDGEAFYADMLELYTTTDMSADEIHELGLREVDRIHGEMREIMEEVGFDGDLQDFFEYLRTDPRFFYEDSDAGRQAYLDDAKAMIDTMEADLEEVFLFAPEAKLDVRKVEPFREQSAGKAFYNRPSMDGSRPGIYYANLYRITDMPTYQMEALAYHEGIPGHHMQFAVTQKLDGLPTFRKFSRYTAHSEGWGLYSEYLPKEMGYYEDPYSDFGRLAMELWRAGRLVVDTGLHHKKWSREEAIDYLKENTPNPEGDIVKAIERYIVMPGQATAYMVGKIKILDERERAREALGEDFDIREFHDVVLSSGPVPLDIMEANVDRYIAAKKDGTYVQPSYG